MKTILLVCLTILVASGCLQGAASTTEGQEKLKVCDEKDEKFKEVCLLNLAYELKDTAVCDRLEKDELKQLCIGRVGVAAKDPKMCEQIRNVSLRKECIMYALKG